MGSRNRFKNNKNKNQFGQSVKVGENTNPNSNVLTGGLNRNQKSKRLREIRESQKYRNNLKEKFGESADLRGGGGDISQPSQPKVNKNRFNTTIKGEELKRTYRDRGGVLRYPYEALTESTDYLQIDINQYESVKDRTGSIVGRTNRVSPLRGRNPFGLTTKSLVNKGTILLQIPSQVEDGNSVNYGSSELNSIAGAAVSGAVDLMSGAGAAIAAGRIGDAFGTAGEAARNALDAADITVETATALATKKIATSVVSAFGGNVSVNQLLQRESGQIFNPNMELLFNGPTLRNFRFAFKMTPRSPEEAEQCKLIIRSFKMNMAPKITSGRGTSSLFLNTPNVFELRYKSGAANHPFLHRFKQCFLTDISVNYTGEGVYATYENREPVSMIMNLTFKELEPIYDQDYFDAIGRDADSTVGF